MGYNSESEANRGLSLGAGTQWAWQTFRANARTLTIAAIPFVVASLAYYAYYWYIGGSQTESWWEYIKLTLVAELVYAAVTMYLAVGYCCGIFDLADEKTVSVGSFFRPRNVIAAMGAAAILSVIIWVGDVITYLQWPLSLAGWAIYLAAVGLPVFIECIAIADGRPAVATLVRSVVFGCRNVVPTVILLIATILLLGVGTMALGIGLLVTFPLTVLLTVWVYRSLTGSPILSNTRPDTAGA